jgi:hypothetical protein
MTLTSTLRLLPAVALLAAAPATAFAQEGAPGVCACPAAAPPGYAAPMAPVVVVAPRTQGWDGQQRWGLGLRLTSLALHQGDDVENETHYAGGGLQLRYRLNARWELELAAEHVREHDPESGEMIEGGRELGSGTLSALFHMRPYSRWDWYLLAGVGGTQDGREGLTEEQRKESAQGHVHLGIGLERRFRHIGIAAELRAVGMVKEEQEEDARILPAGAMTTEKQEQSGGQLNIAATYYF